jgi:hypothetical protein
VGALDADVARWTEWDGSLREVSLDGEFAVGSRGKMVIEGQPPIDFVLTAVEPGVAFTDETTVPGALLRFHHRIEELDGRVRVTHKVEIEGPAAQQMGPFVTADVPEAVEALVALAA